MASHNFSFEGGEILTGMGASWFVSYAYYQHIDKNILIGIELQLLNQEFLNTIKERISIKLGYKK